MHSIYLKRKKLIKAKYEYVKNVMNYFQKIIWSQKHTIICFIINNLFIV